MKISTKKTSFYVSHLFLYRIFHRKLSITKIDPPKFHPFIFLKITLLNLFPRSINNLEICVKNFFFLSLIHGNKYRKQFILYFVLLSDIYS